MKIILVRHGQSESNVDRSILLRKDFFDNMVSLTELGKAQAQEVSKRIKNNIELNKTYLYFSPYNRAKQTKEEILKTFHHKIEKQIEHPLLIEQEFKDFKDPKEYEEKKYKRNIRGKMYYRYKNGESPLDVFGRAVTFLNDLKLSHKKDDHIIVVSHEVVIRCLIHALLRLTIDEAMEIDVHNCEINVFTSKDNMNWEIGYHESKFLEKEEKNESK